jgi:hypothetical protein
MKKIFVLAMLGLVVIMDSSFAAEVKPIPTAPTAVWIKLQIIFHRPKLNCESGFGVCFLVSAGLDGSGSSGAGNSCSVRGQLNDKNQLVIEVEESVLARYEGGALLRNFKDKTSVAIPDPYVLPDATCRALGSNSSLTIKPGNYPVTFQNGVYSLVIQF